MKYALIAALILFFLAGGCIPLVQYKAVEDQLSVETRQRKDLEKRLGVCEEREAKLKEALIRRPPVARPIDPAHLEEIKRQALQEAEQQYKARVIRGKANPTP